MKAKHLVMALRDHFAEKYQSALARNCGSAHEGDSSDVHKLQTEDEWALQYITALKVQAVQPLMEALDDDVSSFVTVAEVNAFTAARPKDWR